MALEFYLKNLMKPRLNFLLFFVLPIISLHTSSLFASVWHINKASSKIELLNKNTSTLKIKKTAVAGSIISSFIPSTAGSGTTITIVGSGFSLASSVSFGGTSAQSFTIVSNNIITAIVDVGTSGTVSVNTPDGSGSLDGFIYVTAPIISYVTPQNYKVNTAITTLSPTNSGGTVPANAYSLVGTLAGNRIAGNSNGNGTLASFNSPAGIATDLSGNVYVADANNNLIRKITPGGIVTTFAGSGNRGFANGLGTGASFNSPTGVATDAIGNVYVADYGNHCIRKIFPNGGVITFAGSGTIGATNANGVAASFYYPRGVATDLAGNVYVADQHNHLIRKITPAGDVTTLAGSYAGKKDGTGAGASFNNPTGVATDAASNVYVTDLSNNLIRKITANGIVTTFAGNGVAINIDGIGTGASFFDPYGITTDAIGNIYVTCTSGGSLIRKITPIGVVTTLAGHPNNGGSVDAIGIAAAFNGVDGLATDANGNLYVAEVFNNTIRKLSITGYFIKPTLPSGLNFNPTNGNISGTPTFTNAATNYIISAYNLAGSSSFILNLAVTNNFIWTGNAGDNNWNTGANWDTGNVPSYGSTAIFNNNKTNTVIIPSETTIFLENLIVGGSTGTSTTIIENFVSSTFSTNYTKVFSNSTLQFTSGTVSISNAYASGNFTLNGNAAQIGNLTVDTMATATITNNSVVTINSYVNIMTGCFLVVDKSSQLNINTGYNGRATLTNYGTINSSGANFTLGDSNPWAYSPLDEIINYGTFSNSGSTFNLSGTTDVLTNNCGAQFICNNCTINCSGGMSDNTASSYSSIDNNGIFLALGSTQIFLNGYNGSIYNATLTGNDTAYFVLGPKSRLEVSGTNSQVTNIDQINPESSFTKGYFILNSDKDNSAYLYQSADSYGFAGQFHVQRYFTGSNSSNFRGYRLVSSPVNSISAHAATSYDALNYIDFSYLNQSFKPNYTGAPTYHGLATGGSGTGFTFPNKNPLLYLYNETYDPSLAITSFTASKYAGVTSIYSTAASGGYPSVDWITTSKGASITADNAQIPVGNGMGVYYVGSNTRTSLSASVPPDDATATFYGYINQGDIDVYPWFAPTNNTLSYTTSALNPNVFYPGTNLVGNPYPATIDLRKVHNDNPSFKTFAELNDVAPHGYVIYSWDGEIETKSGSSASRYIASGQGFFVTATSVNQTLTFHESQKVYDTTLLTSTSKPPDLLVNNGGPNMNLNNKALNVNAASSANNLAGLHLMLKQDSLNFRETGIYFHKKWDDNFGQGDARDFDGLGLKIFLSSYTADGARVGINGMSDYITCKKIKLYVKATNDGTYNLQLSDIANIDQSLMNVYLVDHLKKDSVDLFANQSYSFSIVNADTTTYGANRFSLSIQRKPYQLLSFSATKAKTNITLNWQTKFEGNFTGFGVQKLNTASNNYLTIDSLQSNGTGSYAITDASATTGDNTYRLAQNNINGLVTYSTPVTIKYGLLSLPTSLGIFPNPVVDNVLFDYSGLVANSNGTYTIQVYNSLGVLVFENNSTTNFLNTNVSSLRTGIYIVHIKNATGNILGKSTFIKN